MEIKSELSKCVWPAIPSDAGAQALGAQYQLESTQWMSPEELQKAGLRQLQLVLVEAFENISHWRAALQHVGFQPGRAIVLEEFRLLPLLSRTDIQILGDALLNRNLPAAHGGPYQGHTSGSTGTPVTFYQTDLTRHFWRALTLREALWHRRDFSGKLAAIRSNVEDAHGASWGPVTDSVVQTGPCSTLNIRAGIDDQLAWLERENPDYLVTHPSNLRALAASAIVRKPQLPRLKQLCTFGEVLTADTRRLCDQVFGVGIADTYSSEEAGYIALQCPSGAYHVQAENLLVEILNEHGKPCAPGETGRVVITTLHNFAMPLIRYEIGDFARVGDTCPCGRGLPVLQQILGRQRNMLKLPDGSQHWPSFPEERWVGIAPIRQIQVVQRRLDEILLRVVTPRPLSTEEEAQLIDTFKDTLKFPHRIGIERVDAIPRRRNFKFEDFLSELA
jgi:phenylacetate-CoA ligase